MNFNDACIGDLKREDFYVEEDMGRKVLKAELTLSLDEDDRNDGKYRGILSSEFDLMMTNFTTGMKQGMEGILSVDGGKSDTQFVDHVKKEAGEAALTFVRTVRTMQRIKKKNKEGE